MSNTNKFVLLTMMGVMMTCVACGEENTTVSIQESEVALSDAAPEVETKYVFSSEPTIISATEDSVALETSEETKVAEKEVNTTTYADEEYAEVENQCFELNMYPYGNISFKSYEPYSVEGNRDALFVIEKDGEVIEELNDPREVGSLQDFGHIDAVSFPDLNQDGCDDVIIIMTYYELGGPNSGSSWQEVKCMIGTKKNGFVEDEEFERVINSNMSEYTVNEVREIASQHLDLLAKYVTKEVKKISMPEDFDLFRTYQIDVKVTDENMSDGNDMYSNYGSGFETYGNELKIKDDFTFSYFMGIGDPWEGTIRFEDDHIYFDVIKSETDGGEGHEAETKEAYFAEIDGQVYLVIPQYDEDIYWK